MRKELKKHALGRLKKTYWMMVVLCLMLAVAGVDHVSSLQVIRTDSNKGVEPDIQTQIYEDIILGRDVESGRRVQESLEQRRKDTSNIGVIAISHSRGVLAQLVNGVSSGEVYQKIYEGMKTMTQSKTASIVFFIFLSILFVVFVHVFVLAVFKVTMKRIVMELRFYDKIPMRRFLYLISIRSGWNVIKTMFLTGFYRFMWSLTIIGYFIKSYSYRMVPYILAENPMISPNRAITLSRKMMNGHKWEAFKLGLSFIGWNILEFFTLGISGMLFSSPYVEMTMAEYYAHIRNLAKENNIPDAELLNDGYLYEKADKELLRETYQDLQQNIADAEGPVLRHHGIRGFFENIFGITLFYDDDEKAYQAKKEMQLAMRDYKAICEQNMYPYRLFMKKHKERAVRLGQVQYERHYSVFSLIFMFFTMSFIGWSWEVSLHLISYGKFTNRGFFHGPWLPIYGFGGVLILTILYRFRQKIFVEFLAAVTLCGLVEYYTAWFMEMTHNGTKWWDYSGYFLNIHGRICAEGLLVFGLGGLAIVYLLAPHLDNLFRMIPKKIAILVSVILLTVFIGDVVYSNLHPNAGEGITSASSQSETEMMSENVEKTENETETMSENVEKTEGETADA